MNFVAIDVETANADLASICQIGLVTIRAGDTAEKWSTLVDPEDFFDEINIDIHGITGLPSRFTPTTHRIISRTPGRPLTR